MAKEALKKNNVFDYLEWRGDLSFKESEFNEVDALILTILSYLDYSCTKGGRIVTLESAIRCCKVQPEKIRYNGSATDLMRITLDLAIKAAKSARFAGTYVSDYENTVSEEREMQFSAVNFILKDNTVFTAFRGTDVSLVGWKEDFNLTFMDRIPSQLEAEKYAERIHNRFNRPMRIGGHSKGGNVAVWAGAHLSESGKKKLIQIYDNDGPGFSRSFINSPEYRDISEKVITFIPESSIIGVMMEKEDYITIKSSEVSVRQHIPFSWMVTGTQFVRAENRTNIGKSGEQLIEAWLESMSLEERKEFSDILYELATASDEKTIGEEDSNTLKLIRAAVKKYRIMDSSKRAAVKSGVSKLRKHVGEIAGERIRNIFTGR